MKVDDGPTGTGASCPPDPPPSAKPGPLRTAPPGAGAMPGTGAAEPGDPLDPERFNTLDVSPHAIHMVRTCQTNHLALSQMADHKANILMGLTIVLFTLSLSKTGVVELRASVFVLMFSAFVSSLLAMIAVMPRVSAPHAPDDPASNLLFFGVFTGLAQEDFVDRMMERSRTDGQVLSTMLRDVYQNGQVLQHRKYRYLAYAFQALRIGLVAALLVFLFEIRAHFLVYLGIG